VTITITRENQIYLNTMPTDIASLEKGLEGLKVGEGNLVIINADMSVRHGLVVSAMDEARKPGVTRFAIATDKG